LLVLLDDPVGGHVQHRVLSARDAHEEQGRHQSEQV
jgi:hypothetical protein